MDTDNARTEARNLHHRIIATMNVIAELEKCGKCDGAGNISHYSYMKGGVCFRCDGTGHETSYNKRDAARLRALHTLLGELEVAHTDALKRAFPRTEATDTLPDLESIDLRALCGLPPE